MDILPPRRTEPLPKGPIEGSQLPEEEVFETFHEPTQPIEEAPLKKSALYLARFRAFAAWFRQVAFSPIGLAVWTLLLIVGVSGIASFSKRALVTQDAILKDGQVALSFIAEASASLSEQDFEQASYKFNAAAERFIAAEQSVSDLSNGFDDLLTFLPIQTSLTSRAQLLEAGSNLAIAGKYLSRSLEPFESTPDLLAPLKTGVEEQETDEEGIAFTEGVAIAAQNLQFAELKLTEAQANLDKVDVQDLPEDIRPQAQVLKDTLPATVSLVRTMVEQENYT